ncbi:MAG: RluA family pseudouridine synthase [Cytophagales bacterium]|nr:RluA family pseudouridine synthase [Cytophagales bacterium]
MTQQEFSHTILQNTTPLPGEIPQSITYSLRVKQKFHQLNILVFLQKAVPSVELEEWKEKVHSGNLTINHQSINLDFIVSTGDLMMHQTAPFSEPQVSNEITLLYDDEYFSIMNKPAPLPMHTCGRFARNTLENILKLSFPTENYKPVHRLDSNTTGVVLWAKGKKLVNELSTLFSSNAIEKQYLALVNGIVEEKQFTINTEIGTSKEKSGSRKVDIAGQKAETYFEVLEYQGENTLLLVKPKSGRTNQIRLHLANIGFPIVGDLGYQDEEYFKNNPMTYPTDCLFLHAWKLTFIHPISQEKITFEAPIPKKFETEG